METDRSAANPESRTLSERYATLVRLGESEYVSTYLARDTSENRSVVLKVPTAFVLAEPSFPYLLEREALESLRVKHPHIVRVIDAGRTAGTPFFVTEYIEGESLAHRLSGSGVLQSPAEVYAWLLDVAEALDFIHAKKATHREVRPLHILLARDGRVALTDFVVARALDGLEGGVARTMAAVVRPGFTAPEIEAGARPAPPSDQYSLGGTVFQALVGAPPVGTPDEMRASLIAHVSSECAEDVVRALAPDPAERFASCYEFARAFGLERKRAAKPRRGIATVLPALPGDLMAPGRPRVPAGGRDWSPPVGTGRSGDGRVADLPVADGLPAQVGLATGAPATPETAASALSGRCWRLRMGPSDQYARLARDRGFVAIDWAELGDLQWVGSEPDPAALRRLVEEYEHTFGVSGLRAGIGAGQVWQFVHEMRDGDIVLVPNPAEGLLHVGRIDGRYDFVERPTDGCRFPRRRPVAWLRDVAHQEIPNALRRALAGPATLASLDPHAALVGSLVTGSVPPDEGTFPETALLEGVVAALYGCSLDDFIDLLRSIFSALGFEAQIVASDSDEAWEAMGMLSCADMAEVPLRVWIRRSRRDVGIESVFEWRGALSTDEHGAIVSLGGFSPQARLEASAAGKKPIQLIDGVTLAAIALERWDRISPRMRSLLGVERSEHASIEVLFRTTTTRKPGPS